ncbi:MAG: hypothetical protein ABJB22_04230, partial [Verrucomicrobiota bacterium]
TPLGMMLLADGLTCRPGTVFIPRMLFVCRLVAALLFSTGVLRATEQVKQLVTVNPLPTSLSDDFKFRKTKLYFLSESGFTSGAARSKKGSQNKLLSGTSAPARGNAAIADRSITFERQYRLFGAVTLVDQRQRFGDYFDFFWHTKRTADVTIRLEYQQENLHSFVQAREVYYSRVHGNMKTEFAIIGDDYLDDGRVIAWRCLLIENGHIVAENRSYLWR